MAIITGILQNIFDAKEEVLKAKFIKSTGFSMVKPMIKKENSCNVGSCCDSKKYSFYSYDVGFDGVLLY